MKYSSLTVVTSDVDQLQSVSDVMFDYFTEQMDYIPGTLSRAEQQSLVVSESEWKAKRKAIFETATQHHFKVYPHAMYRPSSLLTLPMTHVFENQEFKVEVVQGANPVPYNERMEDTLLFGPAKALEELDVTITNFSGTTYVVYFATNDVMNLRNRRVMTKAGDLCAMREGGRGRGQGVGIGRGQVDLVNSMFAQKPMQLKDGKCDRCRLDAHKGDCVKKANQQQARDEMAPAMQSLSAKAGEGWQ